MSEAIQQFREAMQARGLTPPSDIIADGNIHRCAAEGRKGNANGAYLLHLDGVPAGGFQNHRDEQGWQKWRADGKDYAFSPADIAKIEAEKTRRANEQQQRYEETAKRAAQQWAALADSGESTYLTGKQVLPCGARYGQGFIAVPLMDEAGAIWSLQLIYDDTARPPKLIEQGRNKSFLYGGRKKGLFFPIGEWENQSEAYVVEGFATGASIHMATGKPVFVTFDAGNLALAIASICAAYPDVSLTICADDDVWADSGNKGRKCAENAAKTHGCKVIFPEFSESVKEQHKPTDFNDLHVLVGMDEVKRQLLTNVNIQSEESEEQIIAQIDTDTAKDDADKISQASQLVAFVQERATLFHDVNSDVYAQNRDTGAVWRIDGRQFKNWLLASFYDETEKSARDQSLREALATLSGLARFKGACETVNIRVAQMDEAYYLDLGREDSSRVIEIKAGSWSIIANAPVKFLRPESMRPLPEPSAGGDLSALWHVANVPADQQILVIAWLIECLRPDTPFPVLELIGEQGSAKSTTQKALRCLIDPNACDLRAAPKTTEDIFVSAGASWITSYENISHLPAPMQDALCVLATGGGYAKRKLYSDADENIISVKRPVVLNGISVAVTAQDLIDRAITIDLPMITDRQESNDLWQCFESQQSAMLGGLLDVMAKALQQLPLVCLPADQRPRLTEFAHLGMAVAQAQGQPPYRFMDQFNAVRQEAIARTIDASPVASAILEWFTEDNRFRPVEKPVKDLMKAVEKYKPPHSSAWSQSAKGFADALRRAAPALRQSDIECKCLGKKGGNVQWSIAPREQKPNPCPESPNVLPDDSPKQDIRTLRTSSPELSPAPPTQPPSIEELRL